MRISMNLLLWTAAAGDEHLPLIKDIKDWGFDGVELPMFAPDCTDWAAYSKALDDLGLGRSIVAVLPEGSSLISEGAGERQAAVDFLKACIDSSVAVGADTLGGPIYHPVGSLAGRGPTDEERARCAEGLREVGEHAQAGGVNLAVEPLNRFETYFVNCMADAAALAKAVDLPNVGILYDTFHANIEEKGVAQAIETIAPYMKQVHISANDRATPGEDHIRWSETFAALKASGFDGWLTIEAFGAWLPDLAGATCIWRKMAPSEEHVAREGLRFIQESLSA
jgi:D-psicose/D-tagatose/L-ribulose 3-epimerase